jgi:hypothetical protein
MVIAITPQPIPAKSVLRRLRITQRQVAIVAGRSPSQVNSVLNSYIKDEAVENALRTLLGDHFSEAEIFGCES